MDGEIFELRSLHSIPAADEMGQSIWAKYLGEFIQGKVLSLGPPTGTENSARSLHRPVPQGGQRGKVYLGSRVDLSPS